MIHTLHNALLDILQPDEWIINAIRLEVFGYEVLG